MPSIFSNLKVAGRGRYLSLSVIAVRNFIAMTVIGFLFHPEVTYASDCITPSKNATTSITLRAAPTIGSTNLGKLKSGETLPLVALMPGWYETTLPNGQVAFSSKRSTDITRCIQNLELATTLERLPTHPNSRIDELLPLRA